MAIQALDVLNPTVYLFHGEEIARQSLTLSHLLSVSDTIFEKRLVQAANGSCLFILLLIFCHCQYLR